MQNTTMRKTTKRFSDIEKELIKSKFNAESATKSSQEIAKEIFERFGINRSVSGIKNCARGLGLTRFILGRKWEYGEIEILHKYGESLPLYKIKIKLDRYCDKNNISRRSNTSIKCKLNSLSYDATYSAIEGEYYTLTQIANALGMSKSTMSSLAARKDVAKILKPEKSGYVLVHINNLRRFIREYPNEIAKYKPDIVWLITILSGKRIEQDE